jgi:hypothetical protein
MSGPESEKVITESTWALKFTGVQHRVAYRKVDGIRRVTSREQRRLCEEHSDWMIEFVHHA